MEGPGRGLELNAHHGACFGIGVIGGAFAKNPFEGVGVVLAVADGFAHVHARDP